MSVWCSNIHLNSSTRQTAVRPLRPLLTSHFSLSLASTGRNLRNPGAQFVRQHPLWHNETQTHAAFKAQTMFWHINHTNWAQMAKLIAATENKSRTAVGQCLLDSKVISDHSLFLFKTYSTVWELHPVKWAEFAASALLHPNDCGSVRGLAASPPRWSTSESQQS